MDQWAFLTLDRMEQMVRDTVLPDDDDSSDEHPWEWLVELLRQQGIESSPNDLQRVPYEVEFSARLRAKIAEHTEIPD